MSSRLRDRLRVDAVGGVVGDLALTPSLGHRDGGAHRVGDRVGVEHHPAVELRAGATPACWPLGWCGRGRGSRHVAARWHRFGCHCAPVSSNGVERLIIRVPASTPPGRLPRSAERRLIVFTGLSGSGKSSLAFDTIYAEGQRRYVESLSAYARQFLGRWTSRTWTSSRSLPGHLDRPEVRSRNRARRRTSRGLRLPAAALRTDRPSPLPDLRAPGVPPDPQQIVDRVLELAEGTRFQVLAR